MNIKVQCDQALILIFYPLTLIFNHIFVIGIDKGVIFKDKCLIGKIFLVQLDYIFKSDPKKQLIATNKFKKIPKKSSK